MKSVDMSKRGAYVTTRDANTLKRTGIHKNRKREADRKACRKRIRQGD